MALYMRTSKKQITSSIREKYESYSVSIIFILFIIYLLYNTGLIRLSFGLESVDENIRKLIRHAERSRSIKISRHVLIKILSIIKRL